MSFTTVFANSHHSTIKGLWDKVLAEAEDGDLFHMYIVGRSFSYGYPVEKDLHKAVYYLSKPAQSGHAESNLELAYVCSELGDQKLAFKHFKAAADNNHPEAQSAVGEMYARGIGVEVNYPMAHKYLLEAANAGIAGAQSHLGVLYSGGLGVEMDKEEAFKWNLFAVQQGHVQSAFNIGAIYNSNVPPGYRPSESYAWFSIAADHFPEAKPEFLKIASACTEDQISEGKARKSELVRLYFSKPSPTSP